jgi:hypothetical protein
MSDFLKIVGWWFGLSFYYKLILCIPVTIVAWILMPYLVFSTIIFKAKITQIKQE